MNAHLVLVVSDGDSSTSEMLLTFSGSASVQNARVALRRFTDEQKAFLENPRNSRAVFVRDLNEGEYAAWRLERQKQTGKLPGELVIGQNFPSAAAASEHLGYQPGYNRVAMLLRKIDNQTVYFASEGGVTWYYEDWIKD